MGWLALAALALPWMAGGPPAPAAAPAKPPMASIEVRLAWRGAAGVPSGGLRGELTLRPAGARGAALHEPVSTRMPARFEVPAASTWEISAAIPGAWSRPEVVQVAAEPRLVALDLYPAGTLTGALRVPPGSAPPERLTVRFRSAPQAREPLAPARSECPVSQGRFTCSLPAGLVDVRLRAERFETRYAWGLEIAAGGRRDLGLLELKPGASIVGWLEGAGEAFRPEAATAELAPLARADRPVGSDPRQAAELASTRRPNARGFFEFAGLAPGLYRLTIRHPGYAPARISPVQVLPLAETELAPVRLEPPLALEARIDPPRDPEGRRWTVELAEEDSGGGHFTSVKKGAASAEGRWTAADLESGSYRLSVLGFASTWAEIHVDVRRGMAPVEVELPFVRVAGRALLGTEPIESLLWFGGVHGAPRVAARSGKDGRFEATLPERPSWRIEVYDRRSGVLASLLGVEIRKPPGGGPARLDVVVPDTAVRGEVVDESGTPVDGARIELLRRDDAMVTTANRAGEFVARGLRPGLWNLEARLGDLGSESVPVAVGEGAAGPDVRLVMRKRLKLSGMVVDPAGNPVYGGQVVATFPGLGALTSFFPQATTDVAGVFTIAFPAAVEGAELTVFAPGFAARQVWADLHRSDALVIPVSPEGGSLVVELPGGASAADSDRLSHLAIFHESLLAPPAALAGWAALNGSQASAGDRFSVPMLEPGHYMACYGLASWSILSDPQAESGRCAAGDLAAGGELVLRPPASPRADRPSSR